MVLGCACSQFTLITIRPIDELQRRPCSMPQRAADAHGIATDKGVIFPDTGGDERYLAGDRNGKPIR